MSIPPPQFLAIKTLSIKLIFQSKNGASIILRLVFVKVLPLARPRVEFYVSQSPFCQSIAEPGQEAGAAGSAPVGCYSTSISRICLGQSATQHTIMHEMGHVAGLLHEHTHTKRDDYIRIDFPFIEGLPQFKDAPSNKKILINFGPANPKNTLTTLYDFRSIMHYPFYGNMFSLDKLGPARREEQNIEQDRIGKLDELSDGDKTILKDLYLAPDLEKSCR
jgi:hypothetical protein